jgi:hypothetical protein
MRMSTEIATCNKTSCEVVLAHEDSFQERARRIVKLGFH